VFVLVVVFAEKFKLDMRRKVEILKHDNNATNTKTNNLTKKQQWSMLVNGNTKNSSQASIVEREILIKNEKQTDEELLHYNRLLNNNSRKGIKLVNNRQNDVIKNAEYESINKKIISTFFKITN
jgi:hypothetical protein